MFKMGLLTSTAMTAVTLLCGALLDAQAQTSMHVADRDANGRFLCTYGQFGVSFTYRNISSSFVSSQWEEVAVPIRGRGQTVSQIIVMEAPAPHTPRYAFAAEIYSNGANGRPGKLIAKGKGKAGPSCGPVGISISPTTLNANQKYWIEERTDHVGRTISSYVALYWEANPKAKREAFVRTHKRTCDNGCSSQSQQGSSYTSPWTKQSQGPWFQLK